MSRPADRPAHGPALTDRAAARRLAAPARRFLLGRKRTLFGLVALSAAESVQTFLGGYGVARALDDGFLRADTVTGLLWLALAAGVIVLSTPVTRGVFALLADLTEPLRDALVRRAVTHALRKATALGGSVDGTAVSRLTSQTEIARDSFAGLVLTARSFVFVAAGAAVGLLSLAPQFLLIVLPPLLLGVTLFMASLLPMARAQHRYLDADEAIGRHAQNVTTALRDIVACGTQDAAEAQGRLDVGEAAAAARSMARWAAVRTLAVAVAGQLPVLLLLVCTPWLLGQGVTAGALAGALTYLLQALLPALHSLMTVLGAAGARLLVVLGRLTEPYPDTAVPPPAAGSGPGPRTGGAAVELRGVRVSFGSRARPVLDGLDLTVAEGEHLAVVGPSGIGKSTLLQVVAGTLAPSEGAVRLAGRSVAPASSTDPTCLRALLPQDAYVFTGTLRDNLCYLCPQAPRAAVEEAVRALRLEPLVARVGGLDATLTPRTLSLGERQLIALGRAHLSPAPVLLLDEATSHLDPSTEAVAERALAARPGTLVVVAHRLSSALRADRVLVLDGTRASCGTHEELLVRSALYRDLVGHWHGTGG
ncbi:ATP-binding cassette domain-containing protein [Streptomyces pristinaespiralis]|uniref:ABC transporter ATP-binding protein n=2 Tax=Streptomyces pristinaespiralis TaxID=38300 RepID=A0A0M4DHB2_STRPR|nr:ABC transporter ATP-binding protein [Streptomyces pristinaespiralis]ALC20717.1 ABC transporter ATP-binding protein [Streptomyces pristinaespiralis]QMU16458.1 ABC transporter ATP-binding protein [Streptomyces pristinaespiralis]